MMDGEHTKNGIQFYTDNFSHQQSIMGVNTITFECFRDNIDYYDVIDGFYKVKKITPKNSKVCTVYAEHVIYDLKDIVVKQSGTQEVVFEFFGCELSTLIGESGIITTALSTYGFTIDKTKIGSTQIYRDISFDSDNYLSAINKICETYGIEYYTEGMTIYFCFEAGKETEVYQVLEGSNVEKIDKQEDISELCTSVIPLGSNEGLPFSYGYKNLRPTKYYYQSKNHGDINPSGVSLNLRIKVIDYQTGEIHIQYSTNGGTSWSGDLSFTNTYQNEYECTTIISGNSNDIRFRFTGKESIYTVLIKDNSSVYSDNTVYYIKEKIHLGTRISNPATNLTYIIDLSQYKFTSENPQLSISTTSPYGIKERVIVFNDIKPELYKGVVKYVHFNADLSGYIKVKESDLLNLINYRQLQEQESTLTFKDNYYFTEVSKLKIIEINNDTIYFAPLSSEEYAKIKDKTGAFRLRVDTDISSELLQTTWTIENYVYAEQLEEASYKLIMEANRYLAEYSKPRITYNINFLFAKTDFLKVGQTIKISRNVSIKINSFTVTNAEHLSYKIYIDSDTYNFYNASTILNLSVNKLITVELENTSTVKKTGLFIININGAEMLRVGYSLPAGEKLYDYIYNGDFARIESFDYSESKQGYTSLKLSTKIKKIPSISVQKQIETDKKIKEIITEVTDLRKNYKATRDSFNLLKQNNFFGSDEEYHVIGSNERDYALLGCNFATEMNKVRWTNGQLNLDGLYYNIPAGVEEHLESQIKYISIKLKQNDFSSATLYFSDTKLSGLIGEYTYYTLGMIQYKQDALPELAFGFGKTYINGGDIVTQTITADKLIKTLALVASQFIQAGNVKIGEDGSGNGYLEIGTETDTYYLKFNQSDGKFKIKADLYIGQGENKIFFEDAGIRITDRSGSGDLATWKWVEFEDSRRTTNRFEFLFSQESDKSSNGRIVNRTSNADLIGSNFFELQNSQNADGSGTSFIALGAKRSSDATPGNVTIAGIMTTNGKAYASFNRAIRLESETPDDQPNGSLLVDSAGNLRFKKGGTWIEVNRSPTNTTSTSDETTEPTFPENPVDGDYHEHTYTGVTPNQKRLYIYKFGKWYDLGISYE